MDTETLQVAARLGAVEIVTLVDGYDKHKTPRKITFRRFTIDDIRRLDEMHELWFESRQGTARRCRRSSQLKTWKRDSNRFECSFKYGMYENVRWNAEEMMSQLLIEI